jgi:D-beta-D-heptose 7-phosphate kinase/D-beta-D-heptose 1-phosphate adenosyltransferase
MSKIHIPDFSKTHILIVGDVMLDRYWHGDTSRISPEAPVPVVKINHVEDRPGGAANVALNVNALGAKATLIGIIGQDSEGKTLRRELEQHHIQCIFHELEKIPTTTKLRVLSKHQQLVRLDFEENKPMQDQSVLDAFKKIIHEENIHAIIFSDYDKGALTYISDMLSIAKQKNIPTFVDPKSNDFTIYHHATVVTPNLKEFQAAVGECQSEDDIITKGQALLKQHAIDSLLITRGEHGMTLLQKNQPIIHLPTQAKEVFDVTGAGDTVIATLAVAHAAGCSLPEAMSLANTAAGVSVSKLGAATVSIPELSRALRGGDRLPGEVMTAEQLLLAVAEARAHGETIVMTNGCFDILHAGHVHYLEQAKKLGDYLIVAVNDDHSVKRLKGNTRPMNNLANRMAVLSGLTSVDWVVAFTEDTPERLITRILPDILVKGGDYKIENVAGSKAVLANGGRVEMLDFVEGQSTTALIEKIKGN